MIALGASVILLLLGVFASLRLFMGPTLYDRALAAHFAILMFALAAAALGAMQRIAVWVDAAIVIVIADLIVAALTLKLFQSRSLQPAMVRRRSEGGAS